MNFGNYVKLDPREHVLKRPGMYMDTIKTETIQRWIYDPAIKRMVWKEIQFCPGLFKIFDEILVNALDHHVRQQEVIKKGSVHSFVVNDLNNKFPLGSILKAASWKAPALNFKRGCVLSENFSSVSWTGA